MTNEELKAWIDDVRPRINPREVIDDADDIEIIDAILQTVRDHIPDDDYEGEAPEHMYYCYDGMQFNRNDTLANAIKDKL